MFVSNFQTKNCFPFALSNNPECSRPITKEELPPARRWPSFKKSLPFSRSKSGDRLDEKSKRRSAEFRSFTGENYISGKKSNHKLQNRNSRDFSANHNRTNLVPEPNTSDSTTDLYTRKSDLRRSNSYMAANANECSGTCSTLCRPPQPFRPLEQKFEPDHLLIVGPIVRIYKPKLQKLF